MQNLSDVSRAINDRCRAWFPIVPAAATRTAGSNALTFADGDEVRISGGGLAAGTRFVVVWVDRIITPPGQPAKKIVYLLRHSAAWPGP